jgi:hypothetical protein
VYGTISAHTQPQPQLSPLYLSRDVSLPGIVHHTWPYRPQHYHPRPSKMAGSKGNLLWIEYDGSSGRQTHQLRSTLRQHAMLNFVAQKALHDQSEIATWKTPAPNDRTISADRDMLERLACPKPTPALVVDRDRLVYRAAWWHCYTDPDLSTPPADVSDWQQD